MNNNTTPEPDELPLYEPVSDKMQLIATRQMELEKELKHIKQTKKILIELNRIALELDQHDYAVTLDVFPHNPEISTALSLRDQLKPRITISGRTLGDPVANLIESTLWENVELDTLPARREGRPTVDFTVEASTSVTHLEKTEIEQLEV